MKLKPSHREKKRYVVYKIELDSVNNKKDNINMKEINREVERELIRFLGIWEGAKAGIIRVISKENKGIIRTTTKSLEKVKATLGIIKRIKDMNARIDVIYVSGTLKKAKAMLN